MANKMYNVKVTPCYYAGTWNHPQQHLMANSRAREMMNGPDVDYRGDPDAEQIWEGTYEEAQKIVENYSSGDYYLAHGEAGRPTCEIVEAGKEDDEPDCLDATKHADLMGEMVDPENLPEDVLEELDNSNVECDCFDTDIYQTWTASTTRKTEEGEIEYTIAFCPRSLALQKVDSPSDILWDKPAYFKIY